MTNCRGSLTREILKQAQEDLMRMFRNKKEAQFCASYIKSHLIIYTSSYLSNLDFQVIYSILSLRAGL
ncbi:hypothetical protein C8P68_101868 [Mucilaginibacter yixingensis]|uniref:Uncharacterized protein n=1 Tax=Mucilaginibacter yixingensis TaxID=1295612 RepID=A0A2T5JGU9_9SPHI|nr:hypothetical protein C8P68_101868 [Mucilaginibacter yixingensis]